MGTFIMEYGKLTIPDNKKAEFLSDAKKVLQQAGLFSSHYNCAFKKEFRLMSFPDFNGNEADFTYSYFEDSFWENAGIDLENVEPYSNKIGWLQFNKAIQALYILAESYSETPYIMYSYSRHTPPSALKWLRYVLRRDVRSPLRYDLWAALELIIQEEPDYFENNEFEDFYTSFAGDDVNMNTLLPAFVSVVGVKKYFGDVSTDKVEKKDTSMLSYLDMMIIMYNQMKDFKQSSTLSEEQQISHLIEMLTLDENTRDEWLKDKTQSIMVGFSHMLAPQITVKIISEIYEKDFWEMWFSIKGKSTSECIKLPDSKEERKLEEMSTEEYFSVNAENRLYWWSKDSDVNISDETKSWFENLNEQYKILCEKLEDQTDTLQWQKRLINFLGSHNRSFYFFEDLYFEFLGGFHTVSFRAWTVMLENMAEKEQECRMFISVLSNKTLRNMVFKNK